MFKPNKSKPHIVRAVSVPTSSYVSGNVFSIDEQNFLGLLVRYTKGDETSLQLKIEISSDGGTTYDQESAESVSGGTSTVSLLERSFAATGNYWIDIYPVKGDLVRISAKATGGTPTGTVGISCISGWV